MKNLILALALSAAVVSPAVAHPEHDHEPRPVAERGAVQEKAKTVVDTMIERKLIEPSWKGLAPTKSELRKRGDATEWVVIYANAKAKDPAKRTLHVVFDPYGEYVAANHTGN